MKKKSNDYIDNDLFLEELIKYNKQKSNDPNIRCSDTIAKYFTMISKHMASRWNFFGYTYREDMISEGIITCLKYMDNFKPNLVIIKKNKKVICEMSREEYETRKNEFPSIYYSIIICTPFNYFSQLVFRSFQQILNVEKKHRNIKTDYEDKIVSEELFVRIKNGMKTYREFNKAISIEPNIKEVIVQPNRILGWEQEIPINTEMSKLLCLFQNDDEK